MNALAFVISSAFLTLAFLALIIVGFTPDFLAFMRIRKARIFDGTWDGSRDRRIALLPFGSLYIEWRDRNKGKSP